MVEEIATLLRDYGLDNNEIKAHLYLVGRRRLTGYMVAKGLKINRSTCYDTLNRLVLKGFVGAFEVLGKKYYAAHDISNVLGRIKSKESILQSLIPKIRKLEAKENTFVKHIDSQGSFLEIDNKMYQLAKQGKLTFTYVISNSPELTTQSSRILIERLFNELSRIKCIQKIIGRGIWNKKFKGHKFVKQFDNFGKNRYLENLPTKATTFIFDGHVAFLFMEENDNVIEIKNKKISEEMKSYFEHLWKHAKK